MFFLCKFALYNREKEKTNRTDRFEMDKGSGSTFLCQYDGNVIHEEPACASE